jgi:competence protein ComEC
MRLLGGNATDHLRTLDLRLVPAAITSWLACIVVLVSRPPVTLLLGGALVVCLGVLAWLLIGAGRGSHRGRWVAVTFLSSLVVVISAFISVLPERQGPLIDAVDARVIAMVEVTIDGPVERRQSRVRGSRLGPPSWQARARLHEIDSRLGRFDLEAPVMIVIDPDDIILIDPAFAPGTRVRVQVRVQSAEFTPQFAAVLRAESAAEVIGEPSWWQRIVHSVRSGMRAAVAGTPVDAGALVAGLAIGDESTQPVELGEAMRVSGLSHLTAVSGGNIAIVLGVVIIIGRLLAVPVVLRTSIGALVLVGYVLVVGPEPSVLRAAGMGAVTVIILITGGARRGVSALAATVVGLLILAPVLALSLGFALSVAATAGLLVLSPHLRLFLRRHLEPLERIKVSERLREAIADAMALTMAAQITTAPILASLGQGLSMVAVPANVLAAPAVAPVTVLGLLAAVAHPILPPLGELLGRLAAPFAGWIAWWAHTLANAPGATLAWPGGLSGASLAVLALLGGFAVIRFGRRHHWPLRTITVLALAGVAVVMLRPPDRAGWPPPGWIAVACDVGQGDAFVVSAGQGRAAVVDAGPDPDAIDSCLADLGVDTIEVLVLTHFHADHVEGVPGVLQGRQVDSLLTSPLREPVEQAERVESWATREEVPMTTVRTGDTGQVGVGEESVSWRVLWPSRVIREGSVVNNSSVVLDVRTRGIRLLLLGDVEPAAQAALRGSRGSEAFDVVKIAHHGSRFQDPRLASWTGGRIALISVGADNDYGHPAPETLTSWLEVAAGIWRTDQSGDIAIVRREDALGVVTRR